MYNKSNILLALVLAFLTIVLGEIPTITYDTHDAWFWGNCQEQLKDYSTFTKTASGSTLAKITKVFNCATTYLSSDYRSKCESGKSLTNFDATVQTYYNNCMVPYIDSKIATCELESRCTGEYDKCTECLAASVCASYKKAGSSQKTSYDAAKSSRCSSASTNCNQSTLGTIAFQSCQDFYQQQCASAWLKANPKDVCNISCSRDVSANILVASLAALLIVLLI